MYFDRLTRHGVLIPMFCQELVVCGGSGYYVDHDQHVVLRVDNMKTEGAEISIDFNTCYYPKISDSNPMDRLLADGAMWM